MAIEYAYCESAVGSTFRTMHIRRLTDQGLMLGGGIDSIPLCGRLMRGWDLEQPVVLDEAIDFAQRVNPNGGYDTCPRCVAKLLDEQGVIPDA